MNKIFVSVLVISYNSEKFIIETLDSIKDQTYKNIELIISDDNSKDDTVNLVNKWLEKNNTSFIKTYLVKSPKNTGISPNINRGLKQCSGEFVKIIAADDILMSHCIEKNLDYCTRNNLKIIFSKVIEFKVVDNKKEFLNTKCHKKIFELTPKKQLKKLMASNKIYAPTAFYSMSVFNTIGLFDEIYPFLDDLPFYIKLITKGYKLNFLDIDTVYYRKSENSVQNLNSKFFHDCYNFYRNVRRPYFIKHLMFLRLLDYEIQFKTLKEKIKNNNKKDTVKMKIMNLFSPYGVYRLFLNVLKSNNVYK